MTTKATQEWALIKKQHEGAQRLAARADFVAREALINLMAETCKQRGVKLIGDPRPHLWDWPLDGGQAFVQWLKMNLQEGNFSLALALNTFQYKVAARGGAWLKMNLHIYTDAIEEFFRIAEEEGVLTFEALEYWALGLVGGVQERLF